MMLTGVDLFDHFELTENDRADIQDILDAATEWANGRMPIQTFMLFGSIENPHGRSPGVWSRFLAVRTTPRSDPRFHDLIAAISALIAWKDGQFDEDVARRVA